MATFEFLDVQDTVLGSLCLRRRELLSRPGVVVTEVTINHEFLMSSFNTESERALARATLERHDGEALSVLVGGLGLGYTAQAALDDARVKSLVVIEYLRPVIEWLERDLVPLAESLRGDPRFAVREADVYKTLLAPAEERYDLILIDVDHSPQERLDESSQRFYTAEGLALVREHLRDGGLLAIWSTDDDPEFRAALAEVFVEVERVPVCWVNELIDDGREIEESLFVARRR